MSYSIDPTIAAFLAVGKYDSIEEWMSDSDYRYSDVSGEWYSVDAGPWADAIDPEDAIWGAIESSGFVTEDGA